MGQESEEKGRKIKVESANGEQQAETNDESIVEEQSQETMREGEASDQAENESCVSEGETDAETSDTVETGKELSDDDKYSALNDKYVRLLAEFENFKRRTSQEMQTRFKFATQSLALNIITGLDNLERAVDQAKEEPDNDQLKEFLKGIEMVQQQLYEAFEKNNIERLFPQGEPFDPNKHEAMGVIQTDDVQPDHVALVFQAGYQLHDRIIRPAMVQVAKKK